MRRVATVSERLNELLNKIGETQQDIAEKTGISKGQISAYVNGRHEPKQDNIIRIAERYNVSEGWLMGLDVPMERFFPAKVTIKNDNRIKGVRVPVLGSIVAGMPLEAIELRDEDEWEEIHPDLAVTGDFFALRVKGSSMEPKISEGDIVIVRQQPDVDNGSLAIVMINGNEATLKKVTKHENGIMLTASNVAVYEPHFYSKEEIESLPVQILGKVVELRAKFE